MTGVNSYGPIGLDVQRHSVCAVQFRRGRSGPCLHAWGFLQVHPETVQMGHNAQLDAIRQLRSCHDFRGLRVFGAIPSAQVDTRPIKVAGSNVGAGQVKPDVEHLGSLMPYPLEAATYDFLPFSLRAGMEPGLAHGLLVSTRKEVANRSLALLRAARLSCEGLDIRATSISRVIGPDEDLNCIVDFGPDTTEIILRQQGEVVFTRAITSGTSTLVEVVANTFRISHEDASRLLKRYPPGVTDHTRDWLGEIERSGTMDLDSLSDTIFSVVEPALNALVKRIHQTIRYAGNQGIAPSIERIVLTGELLPENIDVFLGAQLNCSVTILDDLPVAPTWKPLYGFPLARYAAAAGLALRGMEH